MNMIRTTYIVSAKEINSKLTASLKMAGTAQSKPVIEGGVDDSINIMIVGKPGIGKSTLINGLLGQNVAAVGEVGMIYTEGVTRIVKEYKFENNGITGVVYDTPGLLDSTLDQDEIIGQIREAFSKVDLLLLCIRNSETRVIEGDENNTIIKLLEESLGESVWRKTLVTLVFANELVSSLKVTLEGNSLAIKKKFHDNLSTWDGIMGKKLPGYCGVIPTGHIKQGKLLESDKYHWLTNFWEKCFQSLKEDSKKAALVQLNKNRFTNEVDVEIKGKVEETQITVTEEVSDKLRQFSESFTQTFEWLRSFVY